MSNPLEMSLDEYIEKNQIKTMLENKRWKQQDNRRSFGSRGGGRRPLEGGEWRYEGGEEKEEEEEEEEYDNRWQSNGWDNRERRRQRGDDRWMNSRRTESRSLRLHSQSPADEKMSIEERPARLMVSNLNPELPGNDLKELFAALGTVTSVNIHYTRLGESLGTADITYDRQRSALRAIRHYDGVPLDGYEMKVELLKELDEEGLSMGRKSLR